MLDNKADWIDTLLNLVHKVADSKLDATAKDDKIATLKKANTKGFGRIGIMESSDLFRTISSIIAPKMEEVELPKS
jgi:hypothetical protein